MALTALVGLFLLASFAGPASATPPSAVDLSFDKTTHVLTVSITHDSENTATHYIYKVDIKKNGAAFNTSMYTSQPDAHRFTYTYTVPAADGDTIEVTANCVLFGSLTTKLDVATGKTVSSGGSSYSLWPYHATMMVTGVVLSGLAVSAIYMKKKPWWFKGHRILGALGGGLMVTGVLTAAYMIAAAGGKQFRVPHAWLGISILILVLVSLALGTTYVYFAKLKKTVRKPHLWLGRTITLLEIIEVFLGLMLVGILSLG